MKRFLAILVLLTPGLTWTPAAFGQTVHFSDELKDFPRSQLQLNGAAAVTIGPTSSVRAAYQTLAGAAGVNVIFDANISDGVAAPIHIENATVLSVFDLLAVQTGTFVEVLDAGGKDCRDLGPA